MVSPELWEQLQKLNRAQKLQVVQFLKTEIEKDQAQDEKFERVAREIFREHKQLFRQLAQSEREDSESDSKED